MIAGYLGAGTWSSRASGTSATCRATPPTCPPSTRASRGRGSASTSTTTSTPLYVVSPDHAAGHQARPAEGRRRALPRHRRGPRGRGHRLAPARGAQAARCRSSGWSSTRSPRTAIRHAVANPRDIDHDLVDAQETRRILDRLYGYEVSPGAVEEGHAAALGRPGAVRGDPPGGRARAGADAPSGPPRTGTSRAVRDHGRADRRRPATFAATLVAVDGSRVATGKDFDPDDRPDPQRRRCISTSRAPAAGRPPAERRLPGHPGRGEALPPPAVRAVHDHHAPAGGRPQAAALATRTMRIAQRLYENGYITYMRTDSINLSETALTAARTQVRELYGDEYLPPEPRRYAARSRTRRRRTRRSAPPATLPHPGRGGRRAVRDEFRLYELIWQRTVASQMTDAVGQRLGPARAAPADGRAVPSSRRPARRSPSPASCGRTSRRRRRRAEDDRERRLPRLAEGQALDPPRADPAGPHDQPPARYTEAALVKALEELGIGRPSTYASIMQTIQDRGYVWKKGRRWSRPSSRSRWSGCSSGTSPGWSTTTSPPHGGRPRRASPAAAAAVDWLTAFYFGSENGERGRHRPAPAG